MDFTELAKSRRSVRHFKKCDLTEEKITEAVKEIIAFVSDNTPSWKNSQTHRYYAAVTDEAKEKVCNALVERNRPKCDNALAIIVSCYKKDISGFTDGKADNEFGNGWGAYDLGLSDSLLILKARENGFDTLIMGLRDCDECKKALNIGDDEIVVSVITLGVREGAVAVPGHKSVDEILNIK